MALVSRLGILWHIMALLDGLNVGLVYSSGDDLVLLKQSIDSFGFGVLKAYVDTGLVCSGVARIDQNVKSVISAYGKADVSAPCSALLELGKELGSSRSPTTPFRYSSGKCSCIRCTASRLPDLKMRAVEQSRKLMQTQA